MKLNPLYLKMKQDSGIMDREISLKGDPVYSVSLTGFVSLSGRLSESRKEEEPMDDRRQTKSYRSSITQEIYGKIEGSLETRSPNRRRKEKIDVETRETNRIEKRDRRTMNKTKKVR